MRLILKLQLLTNFIARCDAKARAVFPSLQRRGFPKTTAENIAPSFVHGALLYSSANSQYDSVWCKVLSSKDDDKVRKIFLVKLSDICFIGEGKKNPSKPSNCCLEFEHSDIHLPATQILNRGFLQKFFWISMWNIQGKWSFFLTSISFLAS